MKTLIILFAFLGLALQGKSQLLSNIFAQNAQQKKNLIASIAAINAYKKVLKGGYNIVKGGLTAIGDLKKGEFDLHNDYFNSLKSINPSIKNYSKVAEIINMQVNIVKKCKKTYKQVGSSGLYSSSEMNYVNEVFERLFADCDAVLDQLIDLTTASKLELRDDERMQRIDLIYDDMVDMHAFAGNFSNEALVLGASRQKEGKEINSLRGLHNLN
ncbi:hypothetical protein DBR11_11425 [Pedobacter sp. HMWF019]|uniref:hypothetical protein n=1 Tax=Pedobacter sp. HMWF019 TaxID=2056856 RepID=UPI000D353738|nr:hypothetical protein [Pedobacter sp. HMWF019]PTS99876.1 hypothetical protein DBR11_11425 [Pedobacter sp. HMWF019]